MRTALSIFLCMLMAGCYAIRPVEEPIPTRWHVNDSTGGERASTLLVLLPGVRDDENIYHEQGVIDALEASGLAWDAVAVDAHWTYYRRRILIERLDEDVLARARDKGYERFWFSGPSLGGFGSLFHPCRTDHDDIEGVIAMAPHLGGEAILEHVRSAGSLDAWEPDEGVGREHERELWRCLQDHESGPEIWLAYGTDDHLAPANDLLARYLPAERVVTSEGEHLWIVWVPLWQEIFHRLAEDG